jgi:hypothetical protein
VGVFRLQHLLGVGDALVEPRVVAEEEVLELAAVAVVVLEEGEDPGRFTRIVARLDHAIHALAVRLPLEIAPEAVDGGDEGELEAQTEKMFDVVRNTSAVT